MNLTEKHLKDIVDYLQELPMKYALPLLQYLESIKQEQEQLKESETKQDE